MRDRSKARKCNLIFGKNFQFKRGTKRTEEGKKDGMTELEILARRIQLASGKHKWRLWKEKEKYIEIVNGMRYL